MEISIGKRFWVVITTVVLLITAFVVGRNALHAFKIKHQMRELTRKKEFYQEKITRDSTLLRQLDYDDYLEEYAREQFRMQHPKEEVFYLK